ncbi:MAG: DNA translocase FtsK 4TM domain-containing protein [Bacteroidetes bacterium]|nr:DNA translocase FtsK 4TM domain-containing protein [Bacteroidota bacterium]
MAKQTNPIRANSFREEPVIAEKTEEPKKKKSSKTDPKEKPGKTEKPKREKKPKKPVNERHYRVGGLICLVLAIYLVLAFISYFQTYQEDSSFANDILSNLSFRNFLNSKYPVYNWMGKLGALTSYLVITKGLGVASFLLTLILLLLGSKIFFNISRIGIKRALKYSFFGLVWIPVALNAAFPGEDYLYGVYGFQMNVLLTEYLGYSGLILLLGFTFLSFLILAFNIPFRWIKKKEKQEVPVSMDLSQPGQAAEEIEPVNPSENARKSNILLDLAPEPPQPVPSDQNPAEISPEPKHSGVELQIEVPVPLEISDGPPPNGNEHYTIDTRYDPTLELRDYKFPPLDLLNDYLGDSLNVNKEELEANKERIVETLKNYDIKIQKIKASIGPTVTLYEIVPEAGVRISKIKNLEDDIALSLSAFGIRIIAPIPGKGTIGIEVPNQNPEIVSIKSLIASDKFQKSSFDLPFVLGKTISNEIYIADLTKLPHILMAGATGQGKSVGLNTIITSLLYKKHPSVIKFIMIDPKKVELSLFSKIERHYLAKLPDSDEAIITDTKKVIRTLNSLNIEMDKRYDLLQDAQVRNIKEYNEKFIARKLNPENDHKFLPYLILVIDEFADLIMTAGREIETPLTRLAQLARAVGIHLIIATQRPSVNIITGTIKANFPARIAFRVISKIDSRTILDSSGADQLIGRGDMLLSTGSDLVRIQCAFVDTPEIERVTEYIGSQRGFLQAHSLPEFNDEEPEGNKDFDPNQKDELFAEAARLIVQHQQGSTSLLQRRLKLGYNRAGRIIDQLESAGIVGPFEGSKAREVRYKDIISLEIHLKELGEY